MDELDRRLLGTLADVTRPGVLELSRRLGVARGTVQARLDRLHESGVLTGFGPYVDLKALGFTVEAFTTLEIAQGQESVVIDALALIPEVLEVHKTTGPGDLLCRIVARTNEHLHDVLERVLGNPGINRTTSALALATPVRRPTAYALPDALLLPPPPPPPASPAGFSRSPVADSATHLRENHRGWPGASAERRACPG